jgi:hypothetical protein
MHDLCAFDFGATVECGEWRVEDGRVEECMRVVTVGYAWTISATHRASYIVHPTSLITHHFKIFSLSALAFPLVSCLILHPPSLAVPSLSRIQSVYSDNGQVTSNKMEA